MASSEVPAHNPTHGSQQAARTINIHAFLRSAALAGFRSRLLINVLRLTTPMGGPIAPVHLDRGRGLRARRACGYPDADRFLLILWRASRR
ncbi:hypothetical protein EMIT0158MI4_90129 [Burkholderia ambifaria]